MLRVKLAHLDEDIRQRRRIALRYREFIRHPLIQLPEAGTEESHTWHLFVVRSAHRDALQKHLFAQGIQTLVHYPIPPHRQPAYTSLRHMHLPLTEQLHNEVLSLPMGPTMRCEDVARVIAACQSFECDA
jgi:dTDP-4-amino-4,6-dideoxygalactose transaminase